MKTRVIAITAPTVRAWAVFTNEEGVSEIWKEPVHLWAQVRTGLTAEEKATMAYLENPDAVPTDECAVEAMVFDEGDLVLVSESQFVFLRYSINVDEEIRRSGRSIPRAEGIGRASRGEVSNE